MSDAKKERARKIVSALRKMHPRPKSELHYETQFQFVVAVILSAQCTDKLVNKVTEQLFTSYKTPSDFARANLTKFQKEISSVSFFRNKAKAIIGAAKIIAEKHNSVVPKTAHELEALPGVGYKTAHVVLGELFEVWPGIPTDTHVKRFARKFDLTTHTDLKKISKDLETLVPYKHWKYVNNGLVLYGRYVCKAHKHDCSEHPLTKLWPPAGRRWPRAT